MKTFLGNIFLRLLLTDLLKISRKPVRRWNFIMSFIIRSIEAKSGVSDNNMQISCFFPSLSLSASPLSLSFSNLSIHHRHCFSNIDGRVYVSRAGEEI